MFVSVSQEYRYLSILLVLLMMPEYIVVMMGKMQLIMAGRVLLGPSTYLLCLLMFVMFDLTINI